MASGYFDGHRVSGQFPQHGAIFMSDNFTRKECFKRMLFGLPSKFLKFVQKVKAGMPLFLFDYQERKLYGVFEAITDGSMNIVPHAYQSSRMSFPAQVRFRILWRCLPVPEHAFCGIIKENYYAHNKFHFGLSWNQVQDLLRLFENRKSKVCCLISEPAAECECDISEAPSMSTPEKPDNAGVFDVGELASEDYIPLPSSDGEEDESSSPKSDTHSEGRAEAPRIQCETQVKKLYSDCQKERTSAFHRLSKTSRLKKEAKGRCNKIDETEPILQRLDNICEELKATNGRRASSAENKCLAMRKSVFSRLSFHLVPERKDLKRKIEGHHSGVDNSAKRMFQIKDHMSINKESEESSSDGKDLMTLACIYEGGEADNQLSVVDNVENKACEMECFIAENKERSDSCPSEEQKTTNLGGSCCEGGEKEVETPVWSSTPMHNI